MGATKDQISAAQVLWRVGIAAILCWQLAWTLFVPISDTGFEPYTKFANGILEGELSSNRINFRTPGYPMVLALLAIVTGGDADLPRSVSVATLIAQGREPTAILIVVFQHALTVLTAYFAYRTVYLLCASKWVAGLTAVLYGIDLMPNSMANSFLAETVGVFFDLLMLYLCGKLQRDDGNGWKTAAWAGAAGAYAGLVRPA